MLALSVVVLVTQEADAAVVSKKVSFEQTQVNKCSGSSTCVQLQLQLSSTPLVIIPAHHNDINSSSLDNYNSTYLMAYDQRVFHTS